MKNQRRVIIALGTAMLLMVAMFLGLTTFGSSVEAVPAASVNSANIQAGQTGERIKYVAPGVHTMANTTPVASTARCGNFGDLHEVQVVLVGTMAGTNPAVSIQWQNSIDGANWSNVGSAVVINATTTPANSKIAVADISNASTAVAYGDCWRTTSTWSGTGTVTANYTVNGIEK
jgi:hypothetical protein